MPPDSVGTCTYVLIHMTLILPSQLVPCRNVNSSVWSSEIIGSNYTTEGFVFSSFMETGPNQSSTGLEFTKQPRLASNSHKPASAS